MATREEEQARREALDRRRAEGANAWSPSRAREAMRRALCPPLSRFGHPDPAYVSLPALRESEDHLHSKEAFICWTAPRFGNVLAS